MKSRAARVTLVCLVFLLLAGLLAEIGLREVLFGDGKFLAGLREPGRYADYFSDDDYWKLQHRFDRIELPTREAHPVLGWVGRFSGETYLHDQAGQLLGRRPVLLYGDSFAACVAAEDCFDEILNQDAEFSADHFLLNYGVGGYGTDQILLLMRESLDLYRNPYVVVSLMTLDMDRSVLSVRSGQKPRFHLEQGQLVLDPVAIEAQPAKYLEHHPPSIRSYVYRMLLFSREMPSFVRRTLRSEAAGIQYKRQLNEQILLAMIAELRDRELDFCFLIFHPHLPGISTLDSESDWRDPFLRSLLEREQVPFIWSKDLLPKAAPGAPIDYSRYILENDGHPTTSFNSLIATEIEARLLGSL